MSLRTPHADALPCEIILLGIRSMCLALFLKFVQVTLYVFNHDTVPYDIQLQCTVLYYESVAVST